MVILSKFHKWVGPNKKVGWKKCEVIWAYSFMTFAQNNHPTSLFGPASLFGTWEYQTVTPQNWVINKSWLNIVDKKNTESATKLLCAHCGAVFWLLICFQKKPHIYQLLAMRENSAHRKGNRRTQKSIIIRGHHFLQSYILLLDLFGF